MRTSELAMSEEIHLRYDDGYPEGFSLLDNRDIWDGTGRGRKALLRPATLGVYVCMCSLPRGWAFREAWLINRLGIGRDALRRIIRELEDSSRLRRDMIRDDTGRYVRWDWTLLRAGSPRTGNPSMVKSPEKSPLTDFPATAKPTAGKPVVLVNKEEATNTETTTTTGTAPLDWSAKGLKAFTNHEQAVVVGLLNGHDPQTQQALLDEFAGLIEDKAVRNSPMALLAKLAAAAHAGAFVLNRGRRVRDERVVRSKLTTAERKPGADTESPYEKAVNYARQIYGPDAFEPDKAEFNRRLKDAAEKWPEEAKTYSVAPSIYGKREPHENSKNNLPTTQGASL